MSQRNEDVDRVIDELERYGLRGEVSDRGKHLEIAWVTPHGRRFMIVSRTASDWRSSLNARSDLRKLLRADNLHPKAISELSFQKAMALPKPVAITREQSLQNDVDALTDLVFELQSQIMAVQLSNTALQDKINSMQIVSEVRFVKPNLPEAIRKPYPNVGSRKGKTSMVLSMMSTQWSYTADLIKQSGLTRAHVNNILQKAKHVGLVENGLRGQWRRT